MTIMTMSTKLIINISYPPNKNSYTCGNRTMICYRLPDLPAKIISPKQQKVASFVSK